MERSWTGKDIGVATVTTIPPNPATAPPPPRRPLPRPGGAPDLPYTGSATGRGGTRCTHNTPGTRHGGGPPWGNKQHVLCEIEIVTHIGVRELRQRASRYLAQVKAGKVIEVTERGRLVALLVSPAPSDAERYRLIASGRLSPANSAFRLPERRRIGEGEPSATEVLTDLRRERSV